ncbi:MAG TPA: hypothetical protein VF469_28360, partial [Kofleriaceae bacterium]
PTSGPGATPDGPASARSAASDPFAWPDDDPVSRAARAGCEVVDQAVRRGFGPGRVPSPGPPWMPWVGAWTGGPPGPWTTGPWIEAMQGAFTTWAQWFDAWSGTARSIVGGGGADHAEPVPGESPPVPPSPAPSPVARPLHITVELRCARAASVELDLLPGAPAALEIRGLLAPPAAAAPPIIDVTLAVADGAVTIALGSVEHHPAATYVGAVLAAGRACGTLTVRLT